MCKFFGDAGGVLGLVPAPPSPGVIFTLSQVKLWRGRGTGGVIISPDISPRGGAGMIRRWGRGCSAPSSPRRESCGIPAGNGLFLLPAPCLATVPGLFGPSRCSAAPHGPGKGGFPERGNTEAAGGEREKRERDLTAATAHFTACHALMAEEIKAGMELFIEINQSPRRRGENNIASSVIPGLRAPGRMSLKAPRELDPLGFVMGQRKTG